MVVCGQSLFPVPFHFEFGIRRKLRTAFVFFEHTKKELILLPMLDGQLMNEPSKQSILLK